MTYIGCCWQAPYLCRHQNVWEYSQENSKANTATQVSGSKITPHGLYRCELFAEMAVDYGPRKINLVSTDVIRTPMVVMTLSQFSLAGKALALGGIDLPTTATFLLVLYDLLPNHSYQTAASPF